MKESFNWDIISDLDLMQIKASGRRGQQKWRQQTRSACQQFRRRSCLEGLRSLLSCVGDGQMVCLICWLRAHYGRSKLPAALVAGLQILPFFSVFFFATVYLLLTCYISGQASPHFENLQKDSPFTLDVFGFTFFHLCPLRTFLRNLKFRSQLQHKGEAHKISTWILRSFELSLSACKQYSLVPCLRKQTISLSRSWCIENPTSGKGHGMFSILYDAVCTLLENPQPVWCICLMAGIRCFRSRPIPVQLSHEPYTVSLS